MNATLNSNILGYALVSSVESWSKQRICASDLLVVVSKADAFPTRLNSFEDKVEDHSNLGFVAGVFANCAGAYLQAVGMYPMDTYEIKPASVRDNELVFPL